MQVKTVPMTVKSWKSTTTKPGLFM